MQPINTDYHFTVQDAKDLAGATLMPREFRQTILKKYMQEHGADQLLHLFVEFIGMANSIVENSREVLEMVMITEFDQHPHSKEHINLPTVSGALHGVQIARTTRGMCGGCAFRMGTPANQSPVTSCDAQYACETDYKFMCHERLDDSGEPTKKCAGYAASRREELRK